MTKKAVILLEDGTIIKGEGFGYPKEVVGEIVFNTGMVGYPETLTDPSYKGQILISTYPLVGNYGVPTSEKDKFGIPLNFESDKIQVSSYIISELCQKPNHWSSKKTLSDWFFEEKIPGVFGVDTRELTKKIRLKGAMMGIVKVFEDGEKIDKKKLLQKLKSENYSHLSQVKEVSVKKPIEYNSGCSPKVVLIDCGLKYNIIRSLLKRKLDVIVVPYNYTSEKIMKLNPSGVLISNGPGDPKDCKETIETTKELMKTDVPIFGICQGIHIINLASGGNTYKMKFGHRGQNHPCVDTKTKKCYITSQNHGYAEDKKSLKDFEATFVNGNDGTIEGIKHKTKNIFAVQFHPEATPGPTDTGFLFDDFAEMVKNYD